MRLFEPGQIGKLVLKNRIKMGAMGGIGGVEPDGRLSPRGIEHFVNLAKGGTGLLSIGTIFVSREIEPLAIKPFVSNLRADAYFCVPPMNELAERIHDHGARVMAQLCAGRGRITNPRKTGATETVAPSEQPTFHNPKILARGLTTEEIARRVQAFQFAAEIVREAGIDGVEIRAHVGHLIDQFMTALWNKRTDKYGGDLDGRLTFLMEIIQAIRKGAGDDCPIIVKYCLTHYIDGGREVAEGLEIARKLEMAGVNALEIDAGCYDIPYWIWPSTYQSSGCMVNLAARVKEQVNIPVIAIGKLGNPEIAERVLSDGQADFIALGRPLLADPEWPNKVRKSKFEDVRPCIGDNEGCKVRQALHRYVSCTVNPAAGMGADLKPAEPKKSILVVGGGPAGMEAAIISAMRGHKVSLWEKSETLGGNLLPASVPEFKQEYKDYLTYLSGQVSKHVPDVRLNKEATSGLVLDAAPEVVIIATGAVPITPEIAGITKGNVVSAIGVLMGKEQVGKHVVIIGGGVVGCETALHLARKGMSVNIIEMNHTINLDIFPPNAAYLKKLLAEAKVSILTSTRLLEIQDKGIVLQDESGQRGFETDTVVLAAGLKSNDSLSGALQGSPIEVYAIGDCVKPRKLIDAIWEGYYKARLI